MGNDNFTNAVKLRVIKKDEYGRLYQDPDLFDSLGNLIIETASCDELRDAARAFYQATPDVNGLVLVIFSDSPKRDDFYQAMAILTVCRINNLERQATEHIVVDSGFGVN